MTSKQYSKNFVSQITYDIVPSARGFLKLVLNLTTQQCLENKIKMKRPTSVTATLSTLLYLDFIDRYVRLMAFTHSSFKDNL